MPISEERKRHLSAILPPLEQTQARVLEYCSRADITRAQFARMVGYGGSTVQLFLQGRYSEVAASDLALRDAIETYIGLHPLVASTEGADEGRLYETENVQELRRWFEYCQQHRALAFVYGPPGSQKTFVLQHLIAEFNRRELADERSRNRAYYVRASVNIQPRDMMAKLCTEVGALVYSSMQRCMSSLRQQLTNTQTVIVLDEAQHCGIPALEALRELHDVDPRLGILLAGSHGLKQFFDARAAELEQWNSRLEAGVELSGVSDACAREIIRLECPGLDDDEAAQLIDGSRVADIYSRDRRAKYLSMRRLFKSLANINRLSSEVQEAAQ